MTAEATTVVLCVTIIFASAITVLVLWDLIKLVVKRDNHESY
jgi:hypothetical protein